ncbi:MAG: hypothetical protein NTX40_07075 [Planctomycetota bacterium]|nr:hypothetical protein [Planctomycetota bacterium]
MVWRISSAFLALLTAAVAGAGCAATAGRDAEPQNLACTIERVGADGPGLPERVRVTIRNSSAEPVRLTLPRPLPGEDESGDVLFPLLGLFLRDAQGHEEAPVYADVRARRSEAPRSVTLAPDGAWCREYALASFYFWGPCGPDTGGGFTRYFRPGETELKLTAGVVFDFKEDAVAEKAIVESEPIVVRCAFEGWLFKKNPPP